MNRNDIDRALFDLRASVIARVARMRGCTTTMDALLPIVTAKSDEEALAEVIASAARNHGVVTWILRMLGRA